MIGLLVPPDFTRCRPPADWAEELYVEFIEVLEQWTADAALARLLGEQPRQDNSEMLACLRRVVGGEAS